MADSGDDSSVTIGGAAQYGEFSTFSGPSSKRPVKRKHMSSKIENSRPSKFGRRSQVNYDDLSRENYSMITYRLEKDNSTRFSSKSQKKSSSASRMRLSDSSWPEDHTAQPTFEPFHRRGQTSMFQSIIDLDTDEKDVPELKSKIPEGVEVIEIEDMDDEFERELERDMAESLARPLADLPSLGCSSIEPPWVEVDFFSFRPKAQDPSILKNLILLKPDECVELLDGSFLNIDKVIQNLENDEVVLRGLRLVRTRVPELGGLLPKKLNELCYIFEHVLDDPRSIKEQNIISVSLSEVIQLRELVCTNFPFPSLRFNKDEALNRQFAEQNLRVVVRWKFVTSYNNLVQRARNMKYPLNVRQRKLERFTEDECSKGCFMSAKNLRATYRPQSSQPSQNSSRKGFANVKGNFKIKVPQRSPYTFGDAFCGAGGTTCGAKEAGLKIQWGLDCAPNASKTWVANFPLAKHFQMTAFDMVGLEDTNQNVVDVLHLSPPCQVWSPVHTREGQNDEQNFAALFACEELLKRSKPRFVTLEQTFGILHPKFASCFYALIQMFTAHGYAVSWQILEFQRYGLAQSRRRCILVAAGPGETLPKIPEYTHSDRPLDDGLKAYTGALSIISSVPRNAMNHDIAQAFTGNLDKYSPWDGSKIINCITCDGGVFGHPSGKRGLTHREIAALQSFPHHHVFHGNEIKKQIGNAFASMIAQKVLYEPILKQLRKADMVQPVVVDLTN